MRRRYVQVGSRTLGYLDSSPGSNGAPVVALVHAFPLAAMMWEPQLASPPPAWRLIAPDLRGFGGTPLVEDDAQPPSIDDSAADVVDLLRALGIGRAVFCGLSMGGYVTFAVLRREPDLVSGVVLADTKAGADSLEARAGRRSMLALLDREGPSGIAREMTPKLLAPASRLERPELESSVRHLITQQSAAAIRGAILRLMDRPDATPQLAAIRVPALVVVGTDDRLTPVDEARRMADAIPGAELVVIPRSGHLSSLERPDAFGAALSAFLSRI